MLDDTMGRLKATQKVVKYIRVSTKNQYKSSLGLSAQTTALESWCLRHNIPKHNVVGIFTEVESGKKSDRHRPELAKALEMCKTHNAILVVAKLDRLARNVSFLSKVLDSKINLVALDVPELESSSTSRMILTILCSVAQKEAEDISWRTKVALAEKKEQLESGAVKTSKGLSRLGTPLRDTSIATKQLVTNANKKADEICQKIIQIKSEGKTTLKEIAIALQSLGVKVPRSKRHSDWWYNESKGVHRLSTLRNIMIRGGIYDE